MLTSQKASSRRAAFYRGDKSATKLPDPALQLKLRELLEVNEELQEKAMAIACLMKRKIGKNELQI